MHVDGAVIDLDGTVYRGEERIPGAREGIAALRAAGIEVVFVSNNPTKSPSQYVSRLESMGIDADPDQFVTSGSVTRTYLERNHADDRIYVVGEPGLLEQLSAFDRTTDPTEADVVVGSIDRSFSYDRLAEVARAFQDREPTFVGTDPDRLIPVGDGEFAPGSGAIVGAIAATVERDPDPMLGKPSAQTAEAVLDRLGVAPERCLVVGDRLDTDVALAERMGAQSALVRTGTHDQDDVGPDDPTPDAAIDSLGDVGDLLSEP